jgi:tetratricopeptide (TPR) repeat protein
MRKRVRVFAGVVLLAAATSALPAQAQLSPDWTLCVQGDLNKITPQDGIRGCTNVINSGRENPNNLAVAHTNRGFAYERLKNYDQAIANHTEAIRLNPSLGLAYYNRGVIFGLRGQRDRALADYNQALRIDPKHANAYNNRGSLRNDAGDYNSAIADFTEAIKSNPQHSLAYANRGKSYVSARKLDEAIADFTAAIRINPNYVDAYVGRADAYERKGNTAAAKADRATIARLDPNNAAGKQQSAEQQPPLTTRNVQPKTAEEFNDRCWDRATKGTQFSAALEDCNEALRLKYDVNTLDSRGFVYLRLGEFANAITDYDAALKLDPRKAHSLYGRGIAKLRLGETEQGNADINAAKAVDPKIADEFAGYGVK